jgi:hypothetical protein
MGLTSCRRIMITGMIAHPRRGAQSAAPDQPGTWTTLDFEAEAEARLSQICRRRIRIPI